MGLRSLIFRETFEIKADYGKMTAYFKTKLNVTYYKGYIDSDETQLFYCSNIFKPRQTLPILQLNIESKVDNEGKIKIRIKIVDFLLIAFGLGICIFILFSIFKIVLPVEFPPGIILFMAVFCYAFLQVNYQIELSGFKRELEELKRLH